MNTRTKCPKCLLHWFGKINDITRNHQTCPQCRTNFGVDIAKKISQYLTRGMHHSTKEAQDEIIKIIRQ